MKKMMFVLVFLCLLFSFNTTQAQIWQQIKKAAQQKNQNNSGTADQNVSMENAVLNYGKNKVDPSAVPDSYSFSWKYVMEIKTDEGKAMNANYFLEPNAPYFAMNIDQGKGQNMMMIMDSKNNITVTGFGDGKDKMATASKMPDYSGMAKKEGEKSKYTIKTLPNKTFLGYNCKGIQMTNDEHDIICYYTSEAKVSFGDMFKNQKGWKMPEGLSDYFKPDDRTLLMDMTMKDLKSRKVTTMKCVSLEKSAYAFNKSDYKFM
ncbi:DUF4412 domain-containing protein [Flavobacterium zhairuonense]|uniref:DUF4412 domain-containing protein n=1 Tax=Flavobacterium zhairuonense TaxID=2493631 RepID=UPI0013C30E5F|nr:DUF4412 domain-containing protein [Flavobacterium zhairuonense]KAF2516352.1 DUF4412 domain-containing protein [Flavobacterium zhairuonense]